MKNNIYKCFGISKSDAMSLLSSLLEQQNGVDVNISGEGLLCDIEISANDSNIYFYDYTREIFEKFSQFVYAETDLSLEETVFELLKLKKYKIATAESLTGGEIVASLIKKNENASEVVSEGLVLYSLNSKINRLALSENNANVGVQTTYDMAQSLLSTSEADIVVASSGHLKPSSSDYGLVFLAIGNRERVDVFKNKFSGTRQEIIETATQASLFYLIKKLRKNDF
ncbi:MAG: CinA family protein [Eubacteriales bacterium]|nr:CinA family protein [Eubacteriales bacterium]